jgi:hypothetical protein
MAAQNQIYYILDCRSDAVPAGPYSREQLIRLAGSGNLEPDQWVATREAPDWLRLRDHPDLGPACFGSRSGLRLRPRDVGPEPAESAPGPPPEAIPDVRQLLAENRARESKHIPAAFRADAPPLIPPWRKKLNTWLLAFLPVAVGITLVAGLLGFTGPALGIGGAALLAYGTGLAWVLWQLVD